MDTEEISDTNSFPGGCPISVDENHVRTRRELILIRFFKNIRRLLSTNSIQKRWGGSSERPLEPAFWSLNEGHCTAVSLGPTPWNLPSLRRNWRWRLVGSHQPPWVRKFLQFLEQMDGIFFGQRRHRRIKLILFAYKQGSPPLYVIEIGQSPKSSA